MLALVERQNILHGREVVDRVHVAGTHGLGLALALADLVLAGRDHTHKAGLFEVALLGFFLRQFLVECAAATRQDFGRCFTEFLAQLRQDGALLQTLAVAFLSLGLLDLLAFFFFVMSGSKTRCAVNTVLGRLTILSIFIVVISTILTGKLVRVWSVVKRFVEVFTTRKRHLEHFVDLVLHLAIKRTNTLDERAEAHEFLEDRVILHLLWGLELQHREEELHLRVGQQCVVLDLQVAHTSLC